eukprot:CAMPEP_0197705884 /NCGR_PEP_ID=MMETSP1338-20131121/126667_1 /TAXON_ID=43686 ORGANISM="Pelagodinium beii, Strain RCC1491" /NCGR_SAMPLE_ID=MMETSP1338 /ASSEMBLY_ACC=CAM_ASM_000754 /LENGTH=920 /DNA_ID=CAMNT_0043289793 /DNA_START=12 /DNA_END=2771 /DNA_ORIENTATION=-
MAMAGRGLQAGFELDAPPIAECKDELSFDGAVTISQIVQGVAFMGLSIYLIFVNNAKIAGSSKAPLEQRYQTGLSICVALSLFSGFFNVLQMTGLDDFELPRSTNFVLDLSRPIEWLLTCPMQQYVLVVVGGARLQPWRKFVQPLVTAGNLLCGIAAMFSAGGMQWAWFGFGFCLFCTYSYFACQMIDENSDGEESFFHGDSDYRKMVVITILTWFPFPLWFLTSPEGLGLVTDVTVIQLGWSVLNIVSKFSFVLHLQLAKTRYCKTLDATRELYGVNELKDIPQGTEKPVMEDIVDEDDQDKKMKTLISETMVSLNMSSHTSRFQKLMTDNGVVSTDILERLTEDRAIDLSLPWSLCEAVQKRWRAEKMSMGQDGSAAHQKEDPFKKLLEEGKQRGKKPQIDADVIQQFLGQAIVPGVNTPPIASGLMLNGESRLNSLESSLAQLLQQQQQMMYTMQAVADKVEKFDVSQEAICQRMDFAQQAQMQSLNSSQVLLHKVDSSQEMVMQKMTSQKKLLEQMKEGQESIYETVSGATDANREALVDSVDKSSKALLTKLDSSQQQLLKNQSSTFDLLGQVHKSQEMMSSKADSNHEVLTRRAVEAHSSMEKKMSTLAHDVSQMCEASAKQIKTAIQAEMQGMHHQNSNSAENFQTGLATQEERVSDIRRQNMMIMDMLTSTQERVTQSAESISSFTRTTYGQDIGAKLEVELRGVISSEIGKLQHDLYQAMGLASPYDDADAVGVASGARAGGMASVLSAAVERIEQAATRMDPSGNGNLEEVMRRELSAVAMALAQQQRESAEQQLESVGQAIRDSSGSLQSQVKQFEGVLESSMERFEKGVDKVIQVQVRSQKTAAESKGQIVAELGRADGRSGLADWQLCQFLFPQQRSACDKSTIDCLNQTFSTLSSCGGHAWIKWVL